MKTKIPRTICRRHRPRLHTSLNNHNSECTYPARSTTRVYMASKTRTNQSNPLYPLLRRLFEFCSDLRLHHLDCHLIGLLSLSPTQILMKGKLQTSSCVGLSSDTPPIFSKPYASYRVCLSTYDFGDRPVAQDCFDFHSPKEKTTVVVR